jgi:outer membrane protein assembly factor BamB
VPDLNGGKNVKRNISMPAILICCGLLAPVSGQENWPQWRGPDQNGVSSAAGLPETWDTEKNIVWKTPMPSWSGASPVVWGDRVFVTSPSGSGSRDERLLEGRPPHDPGGDAILLICLSAEDGRIRWQRELDGGNRLARKQNLSSPTPVTDGTHVWVVTGTGTVTAFDMDGNEKWRWNLVEKYGEFGLNFGYASSPVLHDGRLIMQVLHGYLTDDPSYLVACDALTGKILWHHIRPTDAVSECPDAYTTPALLPWKERTHIVVSGGDYVTGHNPATGEEYWRAGGLNPSKSEVFRIIASPAAVDGMIYAPSRKKPLLALRMTGDGEDVKPVLAWKYDDRAGTDVPAPACDGKYLYMAEDRGYITCLDAKTGAVIWGPESTTRATVSASPVLADGKVYIVNEEAVTSVVAAGKTFRLIATNELDGSYTLATPAIAGSRIYIRTGTHLYCIGGRLQSETTSRAGGLRKAP